VSVQASPKQHPPPTPPQLTSPQLSPLLSTIYLVVNDIARRRLPISVQYEAWLRLLIQRVKSEAQQEND
jgi:hypothetical protein